MAINTLISWGINNWPKGTRELLEQVRKDEPNEKVEISILELLGKY